MQSSTRRAGAPRVVLAALVLATLAHGACLPLDDLSDYSSSWERQPAVVIGALDPVDASSGDPQDGGAMAGGNEVPPDASSPSAALDAGPGEPAVDGGEPPSINDGGRTPDAGLADAGL